MTPVVDQFARDYYEVVFERDFLKRGGDAFQDFFATLMEKRFPTDFVRVRAWGKKGDQKNDGYRKLTKTVFQCYAPNQMKAKQAITKIDADYYGAKEHWGDKMAGWTFVHNSRLGLGADILQKLTDLRAAEAPIQIDHWGYEELRRLAFELAEADLTSLLGARAPTRWEISNLGFDELRPIVSAIQLVEPGSDEEVRPVPPQKLGHNRLSGHIERVLRTGMRKADVVDQYFKKQFDPLLGDRIGQALSRRYDELRNSGLESDTIFYELQGFVGGEARGTPAREAAVLAVLAYFFEQCDIFERPPEATA